MVRLVVDAPGGSYPVLIGGDAVRDLRTIAKRLDPSGIAIVTDTNVRPWARRVAKGLKSTRVKTSIHVLRPGERSKSISTLTEVLRFFERSRIDRSGCVIAVGGGTVGDVAGFAAATWQRGIRLVAVPTTLLAMVDSSIGGKTGVNGVRSKNAIGAFWQPSAVLADLGCLETLPPVQLREAFAEVVKYAVAMDRGLFELLQKNQERLLGGDRKALEQVVAQCVANKALVVARDERDRGPRAILNYGHTAGHAIEAASGFRISHGRAVAFGMRVAARIALALDLCGPRLVEAQDEMLSAYGLPDRAPRLDVDRVLDAMSRDKKARGGRIAWVLPRRIGHAEPGHDVPQALVRRVVRKALAAGRAQGA